MAIVPKFEYDPSTSSIRGHVTMRVPGAPPAKPPSTEHAKPQSAEPPPAQPPSAEPSAEQPSAEPPAATHALVYMVAGVSSRWKQVVCYQYTGSSFSGEDAASEVRTLIERCYSVGLQVVAITSDMGSGNRAMWKQFGVHAGRYSRTVNLIPHPQVPGEQIAFLADVPHLIKNLNGHLVRGQTITLPADVVAANGLPCSTVSLEPVRQLAEFQKNLAFKLAPKLRPELLDPNHFEKMKVSTALRVLSHSTATALRFLVENHGWSTNFLTTAWFLEQYLKASKAGSYELDDASFYLADLADLDVQPAVPTDIFLEEVELTMSQPEENSFDYYCGYVVRTVVKNNATCDTCAAAVQVPTAPANSLLRLKNYIPDALTCPSEAARSLFTICESVFRSLIPDLMHARGILDSLSARMAAESQCVQLPDCHEIKMKLIRRFCHARLQLFLREKSRELAAGAAERRDFGSKSMAGPRRRN
ncbi:uncharacterized protein LOC121833278 [Ixodes scapularis]|uniref:uncharacterized protein LOC121833278 n=1 Tax=Ixodes scapularis TaxID=6945 RepID=UPI001C38C34F|nr:uncharacterized protein LOC121833278 [Ixodes scapularis]